MCCYLRARAGGNGGVRGAAWWRLWCPCSAAHNFRFICVGPLEPRWATGPSPLPPITVCWNRVQCGHFLGIKMQHWNKFWAQFCKILLVFEVSYQPWVKGMPGKSYGKRCLKFSFFLWFTHWWNHLCETDWLGVGKDIKWRLKFCKNELRL